MCHLSVKRLLLPKSFQIIILAFFLHQNHNICSEKGIFERTVNATKKKGGLGVICESNRSSRAGENNVHYPPVCRRHRRRPQHGAPRRDPVCLRGATSPNLQSTAATIPPPALEFLAKRRDVSECALERLSLGLSATNTN